MARRQGERRIGIGYLAYTSDRSGRGQTALPIEAALAIKKKAGRLLGPAEATRVGPQTTLGGPDGKKDILARRHGRLFVAAGQ
jgi:hypothetical protein